MTTIRKENLILFKRIKKNYLEGKLEGMSINAIAQKYGVHGMTVKSWLKTITSPDEGSERKGRSFSTFAGIPTDWQWIKFKISDDLKAKYDGLSDDQKVILSKLLDSEIKLLSESQDFNCPIPVQSEGGPMSKFINLRVSPDAIACWNKFPTIRERSKFSKNSWGINKVLIPYFNTLIMLK